MRIAVKWGLFLGMGVRVWTLIVHLLGFYTSNIRAGQNADIAAIVLPVAAVVLALVERHREAIRVNWFQAVAIGAAS